MSTPLQDNDIVIVSAQRTAMGGFMGALSGASATELGASAIKGALASVNLDAGEIDEVIMGCVLPAALGQAPARQAMLKAGMEKHTGATTINKVCGSGLKAVMLAHDLIKAGSVNSVIAGGMESMSNAPYMLPKARSGMRMGHGEVKDHMMMDGLEDAYDNLAMGCFAQSTADQYDMTREQMDEFALNSLAKANKAIESGAFKAEITAHTISSRKGDVTVEVDEQPGNARPDKIPSLRPAFKKDGTITAANSSSISDGAAALVVMSYGEAQKQGMTPIARISGHSTHSRLPAEFTIAPVGAMEKLLKKLDWQVDDVDLWEINEAFAMVTMLAINEMKLDADKVNVHGGACALGHPIGASGARILTTLIHALRNQGKQRGVASLCIGGGEAVALAIETL
ncbi:MULTISPECIES: thiolase family protein [Pseudoalteromonas]|uniref:Acetyl-CoA acetyltransferase n=1 Tax=Pseudoalteromonas ruthenica TaxID=151081 RepID=A0A0F4PVR2_9GAMM|nr:MULTISPECIES: acetyl-CoA C-acyltransferase [Pseudoalteromonas]KJY99128.1 acetyl-CoA acetyltransferase [Pseudoalteromonas ruthenica]KJY99829.1 acetyl-CoA acetyltransferase [Pseudoalteromonas ruthenica]MCG7542614.1 acetyl-CoA C-acyltransferase [Pseudoalteromonas sp. MM17-2]MCG7568739.1 acetyl-CoA C-acyltransferase [Pseudoalteromonas sp. CNC9-20]TMO88353.1 acetyl-CoA C-acyltransferase [Pseudoalteromonas ruthenica]|tara:strand:- start:6 stop:1199 length:1194 start_codon:yes stop_codon:yes gene_type:complete